MEYKLIEKAFSLRVEAIVDEPWNWDDIIVYAESRSAAKSKGVNRFDGAEIKDENNYGRYREVRFLDIKAHRHPELDKYDYNGQVLTKEEIEQKQWIEARDNQSLALSKSYPNSLCVIWAGVYKSYWGPNRAGYTAKIEHAGKYTTIEAYNIVRGSDYSRQQTVILLDTNKYNEEIDKKIQELTTEYHKNLQELTSAKI